MKKLLLAVLMVLLMVGVCFGAGSSVTETYRHVWSTDGGPSDVSTLSLAWVSDDSTGAVSGTTSTTVADQISGKSLVFVVTDPGATAPTDDYDITITDANGVDVMGGALANRDTANTEQAAPVIGLRPVSGTLTLNITNAGNSKVGTVILYFIK